MVPESMDYVIRVCCSVHKSDPRVDAMGTAHLPEGEGVSRVEVSIIQETRGKELLSHDLLKRISTPSKCESNRSQHSVEFMPP